LDGSISNREGEDEKTRKKNSNYFLIEKAVFFSKARDDEEK